jgi:hypothetical protein
MRDHKKLLTGQRTFCKGFDKTFGVTPVEEQEQEVLFTDTSGGSITCNYFSVRSIELNPNTRYSVIVEPIGLDIEGSYSTTLVPNYHNNTNVLSTSGICGIGYIGVARGVGSVEWKGSNTQSCTGIKIKIQPINIAGKARSIKFMVEYGNVFPYNPLRTDSYDLGL